MPGGRPRTVSPEPEELEKLGQEMVKWVKENDPLHLSAWYSIEKMFLENVWVTMIQRPEFVGYYEVALKMIGQKYLDKDSRVREGSSQRWQRVYFKDLRKSEDEDVILKAEAKSTADLKVSQSMQHQKVIFEVNYTNDNNNPIKISPQTVSTECSEVSE